jgi:hypothetical protein
MRLPLEPLLNASGLTLHDFVLQTGAFVRDVNKAKANGISVTVADNWATRLDLHPVEVYGIEMWMKALGESLKC